MVVVKSNKIIYFDVDDTLVSWSDVLFDHPDAVAINHPDSNKVSYLKRHSKNIEQMQFHKLRGHTIVVWSAGGWAWAEAAVKALKLEEYVDLVVSKPDWIVDDKQPEEFMPRSFWIKD